MSILGTRVVRTEDPLFLTRGASYTDDLIDERLAGAVHATFVRSQVAHGRIAVRRHDGGPRRPGWWRSSPPTTRDLRRSRRVPMIDEGMTRPLAGHGHGPLRRRHRRRRPHRGALPGRGRRRAGGGRLSTRCPPWSTPRRGPATRCCFPRRPAPTCSPPSGEPAPTDFFAGCEVVVTRGWSTSGWRRCRWRPGPPRPCWGEDGRLHDLVLEPGRAGRRSEHRRRGWGSTPRWCASSPPTSAAGSAPRSARTPSTRSSPGSPRTRPPGALGRDPLGEPGRRCCTAAARTRSSRSAAGATARVSAYRLDVVQDGGAYPRSAACCRC